MKHYFTYELIIHFIYFQIALLVIILSNIWIMTRSRRKTTPDHFPMVSVLVPARDEERNIANCVHSLLHQKYPSFEVLVLDDQSSDQTHSILLEVAAGNPNVTILTGKFAPEGMLGKNWACTQLAAKANGDLLLFTDADTQFSPDALRSVVGTMLREEADLLTGYPHQILNTWGERFLVPFFTWAMMCFNSLTLAYLLNLPTLSSAVGQMMLFKRDAYAEIGGHAAIGHSVVDDLSLARNIVAGGFRLRVTYIADIISCQMYHNAKEAWDGFTKNLFAVFNFRILPFLFAFIWLVILFWWPLLLLLVRLLGSTPLTDLTYLIGCILLSILLWLIPYSKLRLNIWLAFLYPVTILAITAAAYRSLYHTLTGKITWKGRQISKANWKWI